MGIVMEGKYAQRMIHLPKIIAMLAIVKKAIGSNFLNYSIKVFVGFAIGYGCLSLYNNHDLFWMLLSIILVISPEEEDSKRLTVERVKSNFIGSLAGLATWFLPLPILYKTILAIIVALLTCRILNLLKVARTSIVTVLIVLIESKTDDSLAPLHRFVSVAVGCLIGLLVSFVIGSIRNALLKKIARSKA